MPHSLRAKLSGLRYKGILEDKDYKRLCKALDNENVLERIRAEIEQERDKVYQNRQGCDTYYADGLDTALDIIDKYKGE